MGTCKIFIASSDGALTLAEKLRDELRTDFCEARLWSEEIRSEPGAAIIEMLEKATVKYDFAVIVLTKDDVLASQRGNTLKTRDNCIFEAGLFMSAIGRERCFLVTSVAQGDLPSDLGGIISKPFVEPPDLKDRGACAQAISRVVSEIKDAVFNKGCSEARPFSQAEILDREKLKRLGGDLDEDQVVVTAIQPALDYEPALQVRKNMDGGINYVYFFHGSLDGATKISRLLQKVLLAPMIDPRQASDFKYVQSEASKEQNQNQILQDLKQMCERESLKICFLPAAPHLQFCVHNATSVYKAVLYFKRGDDKWLQWEKGEEAYQFWAEFKHWLKLSPGGGNAVFLGASGFDVKQDEFCNALKNEMRKYFPGIHERMIKLCFEGVLD